jgi:hypothetical protein
LCLRIIFAHFERGVWLTLVTSFKEIPDTTFLQLISKVHVTTYSSETFTDCEVYLYIGKKKIS